MICIVLLYVNIDGVLEELGSGGKVMLCKTVVVYDKGK